MNSLWEMLGRVKNAYDGLPSMPELTSEATDRGMERLREISRISGPGCWNHDAMLAEGKRRYSAVARKQGAGSERHDIAMTGIFQCVGDILAGCGGYEDLEWLRNARGNAEDFDRLLCGAVMIKLAEYGRTRLPRRALGKCPHAGMAESGNDGVEWLDEIPEADLEWLHYPVFPAGSITIIDGDPAAGKSLITVSVAAAAVTGRELLPWGEKAYSKPFLKVLFLAKEDDPGRVLRPRLRVAGADLSRPGLQGRIAILRINLTLPQDEARLRMAVANAKPDICILDPVTDFVDASVNTANDASVRRMLWPIKDIAEETGICFILVRHLNKGSGTKAVYRGGGSIAFSAVARSGLVAGELPDGLGDEFGIAQVPSNYAPRELVKGTHGYSFSSEGGAGIKSIPRIEWGEYYADISASRLLAYNNPARKPGPDPYAQEPIKEVLWQLFAVQNTYTRSEVTAHLDEAGVEWDKSTLARARRACGIYASPRRGADGRVINGWIWTTDRSKIPLGKQEDMPNSP